jgi:hypothetical protein
MTVSIEAQEQGERDRRFLRSLGFTLEMSIPSEGPCE